MLTLVHFKRAIVISIEQIVVILIHMSDPQITPTGPVFC